ncbi:MAG: HAD hydrolase-like protein, partial [Candidatus Omnitrophica bacterium]|nr:HAD hydrolase-like protein [Candidatus Omnitrophota bacterium]
EQAARDISFIPSETYFVGDKVSDVQAGKRFGLKTLFVLTGHGTGDKLKLGAHEQPEQVFPSLKEAVDYIVNRKAS